MLRTVRGRPGRFGRDALAWRRRRRSRCQRRTVSRGDDQAELSQAEAGELMEQRGEEHPIGSGEAGFVDLTLQDAELMAQRQDLDVLVGVAHRQQPYEGEHARER
jgi:hypothetical protein